MSPLLEPGWTQYGLDGHLKRKAKDYLHQFVYALSLEDLSRIGVSLLPASVDDCHKKAV